MDSHAETLSLLPFRFSRLQDERVLISSDAGEWHLLSDGDFAKLAGGRAGELASSLRSDLESKHFIFSGSSHTAIRLSAAKLRTRKSFLKGGPALHIFVVSLRCDHGCSYCQVSRQTMAASAYEMSEQSAIAAVDRVFDTPARELTIEFQGGEPLLAFPMIRFITERAVERNKTEGRLITFTITSTLHHLTDEIIAFFREHDFQISTSLDGPAAIHDTNRPIASRDSHARTVAGIERVQRELGPEKLSALTTLTSKSLSAPEDIVDEYVRLGFRSIFLRPLSPFGFARRSAHRNGYESHAFLSFYRKALNHILRINADGTYFEETSAGILLRGMLTPYPTTYVDMRSPAGAGFGALVYNYDGSVYASDEGRMLAEAGDHTYRLGSVTDSYQSLMASDAMQLVAASGFAESLPGCADCAFVPFCGADPVMSSGESGRPVNHRSESERCRRQTGIFNILFGLLGDGDPQTLRTLISWAERGAPRREAT